MSTTGMAARQSHLWINELLGFFQSYLHCTDLQQVTSHVTGGLESWCYQSLNPSSVWDSLLVTPCLLFPTFCWKQYLFIFPLLFSYPRAFFHLFRKFTKISEASASCLLQVIVNSYPQNHPLQLMGLEPFKGENENGMAEYWMVQFWLYGTETIIF